MTSNYISHAVLHYSVPSLGIKELH